MIRVTLRHGLLGAALVLGLAGAAFGRGPGRTPPVALSARAPATITPFELARVLAAAPPEVVVVALDAAERPLRGALPASALGADDNALVTNAPRVGRVVLAARDPVRADRLARRLLAAGCHVAVLDGGIDAWDRAMRADPAAPPATADAAARDRWAHDVALRRAFGDPNAAPTAPVRAVVAPVAAPSGAAGGRREGC